MSYPISNKSIKRVNDYAQKDAKPFSGLTNAVKEVENMRKAKLGGKAWQEKNEKRGFYPKHPAIKSVERHNRKSAKGRALDKAKE
jgi:hypothetical protein